MNVVEMLITHSPALAAEVATVIVFVKYIRSRDALHQDTNQAINENTRALGRVETTLSRVEHRLQ